MSIDIRDAALQAVCPSVMVPRFGTLQSLQEPGHRFLVAADGLWIEAHRPWVYIRQPIARQEAVAMPYGRLTPAVHLAFGSIPRALLDDFAEVARAQLPNECAAWIVWSERGGLELRHLDNIKASPGYVQFHRPELSDDEHLVIDLHSHGMLPAFFSATDNHDDKGEIKLAAVVGNLDYEKPSMVVRLCVQGLFIDLSGPTE